MLQKTEQARKTTNSSLGLSERLGLLTPKTMIILAFFLEDPLQGYYEREVVRKTGISLGSISKILRTLAKLGFLTKEERGRLAIYKPNLKEAEVRQLKVFFNTLTLKPLTDELKGFSKKILLFGSCSQGTDARESDIDLLVMTDEKEAVNNLLSEFNLKNDRRISPILVNMNEFVRLKKEDSALYENIEKGITLWETE